MSKVIYLGIMPALANITANYQQFGFAVSNTGTACNLTAMATAAQKYGEPNPQAFATSLFCSPETLTVAARISRTCTRTRCIRRRICMRCMRRRRSRRWLRRGWGSKDAG